MRVPLLSSILILLVISFGATSCGDDSTPLGAGAAFEPPAVGSGLGLLVVDLEPYGMPAGWHGEDGEHGGQGHHPPGDHTDLTSLFLTLDSIRIYPTCAPLDSGEAWHHQDPCHEDHQGDGEHAGNDDHPDHHGQDYFEILTGPVTVDVLDPQMDLAVLLGTLELPTGDYGHIVVRVVEAAVVTPDGDRLPVLLPDRESVFVPIPIFFTIEDGTVTEVTLVHDLERSIREDPPGSGQFHLTPVMEGHRGHEDHDHGGDGGHGHHG